MNDNCNQHCKQEPLWLADYKPACNSKLQLGPYYMGIEAKQL